jgi:hypothetical protein
MNKARAVGGHIEYDPLATITAIAIVPAPRPAQDYAFNLSGQRPAYAIVETLQGPLNAYIVDKSGNKQLLGQTPAGQVFRQAFFGQYRVAVVGALWFQLADDDCGSAWLAGTCAT